MCVGSSGHKGKAIVRKSVLLGFKFESHVVVLTGS
jgi:hypothetical protein